MNHPRRIARTLAAAALALAIPAAQPAAQTAAPDGGQAAFAPAAFVNDKVVTRYDIDQRRRLLRLGGGEPSAEDALDSMIADRLKRDAAEAAGITASREDVERGLANFARSRNVDAAGLQRLLKRAGVSRVTLRDYIETELLWTAYVRRNFLARARVTDLEVEDEIENSDRLVRVSYDLIEIGMPFAGDREGVMARAADISRRINAGEDASALARRFSRSPSRARGGRVGFVPQSSVPGPIRAQLERLSPGQATPPIPIPRGVVVLTVNDVKRERVEVTPELREQVRNAMLEERLTRLADGRLSELRAAAFIDRRR